MASIVLADKDKRFDCKTCMDGSNWKAQGRDDAFIDGRIRKKMIGKGCTSETQNPVFRLTNGDKIFRCPRALSDEYDSLSHYRELSALRDGLFHLKESDKPSKWYEVMQVVRAEINAINKPAGNNSKLPPPVSKNKGRR